MKGGVKMTTIEAGSFLIDEAETRLNLLDRFEERAKQVEKGLVSAEAAGREMREDAVGYLADRRELVIRPFFPVGLKEDLDTGRVQLVARNARNVTLSYEKWVPLRGLIAKSIERGLRP